MSRYIVRSVRVGHFFPTKNKKLEQFSERTAGSLSSAFCFSSVCIFTKYCLFTNMLQISSLLSILFLPSKIKSRKIQWNNSKLIPSVLLPALAGSWMFYLCSKSVTTGPKSTGNGGVTPGRHHLACFLFMSIMQHFLTASLFSRAFNTCFRLVAINIRWSISYSQVSQQPTCLTRLNRLIYCKRALMSVVRRDR